jgi:hypothetical protein
MTRARRRPTAPLPRSNFKALLARVVYINQTVIELDSATSDSVVNLNGTVNSLDAFYAATPSPLNFTADIDALAAKLVMPNDTAAMKTNSAGEASLTALQRRRLAPTRSPHRYSCCGGCLGGSKLPSSAAAANRRQPADRRVSRPRPPARAAASAQLALVPSTNALVTALDTLRGRIVTAQPLVADVGTALSTYTATGTGPDYSALKTAVDAAEPTVAQVVTDLTAAIAAATPVASKADDIQDAIDPLLPTLVSQKTNMASISGQLSSFPSTASYASAMDGVQSAYSVLPSPKSRVSGLACTPGLIPAAACPLARPAACGRPGGSLAWHSLAAVSPARRAPPAAADHGQHQRHGG